MKKIYPLLLLFLPSLVLAQSPVQTLRGTVTDADNGAPLSSANLVLSWDASSLLSREGGSISTATDESGHFSWSKIAVGRYRLQVSYVGYETVTIAEVLIEAGKEAVQNVQLRERSEALHEVVVKAQARNSTDIQSLSAYTMTVEEQFRFPATFYDPGRLAMSYPGVAGVNDGTNIICVRGNAPGAVKWRLEGVEIVNPNHTANAGTFSDRPTQAGGGVNILSAQLLGTSNFLTGAFPVEFGNALGGIFDMQLRPGNNREQEFTVQAGLIGIDLAAEGPLRKRSTADKLQETPSYLVNYRYSFTGLLSALGADFGDEATAFQDLSFHVALPSQKTGRFSVFGLGGKSSNVFTSPEDTTSIREDKQRFNIDFKSKMGAVGLTHLLPLGKNSVLRSVVAVSALDHERKADLVWRVPAPVRWAEDGQTESRTALSSVFSTKINARNRFRMGLQASQESLDLRSFFNMTAFSAKVNGLLLQPFADWQTQISPKLNLTLGLRLSYFTGGSDEVVPEPRMVFSYSPDARRRWSLAYNLLSQLQYPELYAAENQGGRVSGFIKSHHLVAGFRQIWNKSLIFNVEIYYQHLFDVLISDDPALPVSTLNLIENFQLSGYKLIDEGKGRNHGLDLSLQKFILEKYYFIIASSFYRSLYTGTDGVERSSRFDGRYMLNLTGGREFFKIKAEKTLIRGLNAHFFWSGGFRVSPVDVQQSMNQGRTVYDELQPFSQKLEDYFRLDLRFYLKWNKTGRNSTLSIDIQNITNRKNIQYYYYDSLKAEVVSKTQLGLIPILSWRVEF